MEGVEEKFDPRARRAIINAPAAIIARRAVLNGMNRLGRFSTEGFSEHLFGTAHPSIRRGAEHLRDLLDPLFGVEDLDRGNRAVVGHALLHEDVAIGDRGYLREMGDAENLVLVG